MADAGGSALGTRPVTEEAHLDPPDGKRARSHAIAPRAFTQGNRIWVVLPVMAGLVPAIHVVLQE